MEVKALVTGLLVTYIGYYYLRLVETAVIILRMNRCKYIVPQLLEAAVDYFICFNNT